MFQSTRPRGARRFRSADQYRHCLFQSTRPYGARRNDANGNIAPDKFQSTRPRGARRDLLDDCKMADQFQSTRPRGARPRMSGCRYRTTGFNPRARVGRDSMCLTLSPPEFKFQSTRPRGARPPMERMMPWESEFQSTRPRGARHAGADARAGGGRVSIHAPAWGATQSSTGLRCSVEFQSTRPRGARRAGFMRMVADAQFQSTRPRGARLLAVAALVRLYLVSIHAPAWGATPAPCITRSGIVFQSTRPRGARQYSKDRRDFNISFQSTRPRGARLVPVMVPRSLMLFQSTRPRGARLSPNWTNTNYSTKQSYIQAATKLTKITRPAVPQFCCQGTRANIVINQHHLPFARHRARRLAKPQGHKVSSHQNAPPFFANSSRGYIHAGYLLTHQ